MKDSTNRRSATLAGGWIRCKVPLPFSLKWVNAYLLPEDDGGWTLIDPGLRTADTERYWEEELAELGIAWEAIRTIVVTHHHPDHYGLAGWFQEKSGAPVCLSGKAREAATRLWGEGESFSDELTDAFLRHGLPKELAEDIRGHLKEFTAKVSPHPARIRLIEPGDSIRMGGTEWEAIGGEGHAPGHLSFYDRTSRKLLCADQVLPDISPNIGWMPGGDPDPLGSFMDTLRGMETLEVSEAFPGHRDPFPDFRGRLRELLEHHERRLAKMAELAGDGEVTSFELCERLFGERLRGNAHNLRFALAETIAHVVQLELRAVIERIEDGETIRYRRK